MTTLDSELGKTTFWVVETSPTTGEEKINHNNIMITFFFHIMEKK